MACNPSIWEVKSGKSRAQDWPLLGKVFEASLYYRSHCVKKEKPQKKVKSITKQKKIWVLKQSTSLCVVQKVLEKLKGMWASDVVHFFSGNAYYWGPQHFWSHRRSTEAELVIFIYYIQSVCLHLLAGFKLFIFYK